MNNLRLLIVLWLLLQPAAAVSFAKPVKSEGEYFKLALAQIQKGHFDYGIKVLSHLVRVNRTKALYWFNLGNAYFLKAQYDRATYCYRQVTVLKSPLSPVGLFYSAKSYRKLKKYASSRDLLIELSKIPLPKNLAQEIKNECAALAADYLNAGLGSYREGSYETALSELDQSLVLGPTAEAETLRAVVLLRLGRAEAARESLRRSVAITPVAGPGMGQGQEARELLQVLSSQAGPDDAFERLALSFASGYSSNVNSVSTSESETSGVTLKLNVEYRRQSDGPLGAGAGISGYFSTEEILGQTQERAVKTGGGGFIGAPWRSWIFYLLPMFQVQTKASALYLFQGGGGLAAEKSWGDNQLSVSFQHLQNIPLQGGLTSFSGYTQVVRGSAAHTEGKMSYLGALVASVDQFPDIEFEDGLLPVASKAFGPTFSGMWKGDRWQMEGQVSYQFRFFDHLVQPGNEPRKDRELQLGVSTTRKLGRQLRAFVALEGLINRSSLGESSIDDRNYTQWNGKGGVLWEI